MPRIADTFLDCVIYLYPSAEAAEAGVAAGGTGFLVIVPSEQHKGQGYLYAVTNKHVVDDFNSPVIRINTVHGDSENKALVTDDWVFDSANDDLAAYHLGGIDSALFTYSKVNIEDEFFTDEIGTREDIGVGDDVFVVGRFISHGGVQRNEPSARFGNISMMATEPIENYYRHLRTCFLVEVRSLRGSSGSPVFVYIPPFTQRPKDTEDTPMWRQGMWLLGIACADIPYDEPIIDRRTGKETEYFAQSNSGVMAVIPAQRIRDFLMNEERFVMARKKGDKETEDAKAS